MQNKAMLLFLASLLAAPAHAATDSPLMHYPLTVDLRSQLTPVKAQGQYRGTCNSFAATALMEFLVQRETGQLMDLSEQYTYFAGRTWALSDPYTRPMYQSIDGLAGFLAVEGLRYGAVPESAWPYDPNPQYQFTGIPPAGLANAVLPFAAEPIFVPRREIARFLVENKTPVAININWYFSVANKSGDFGMPSDEDVKKCLGGDQHACGGHVILLVGYDEVSKRYLFRNSHGPAYGYDGYGTMPEEYIVRHCEVCGDEGRLNDFKGQDLEFMTKALQGVSAKLIRRQ